MSNIKSQLDNMIQDIKEGNVDTIMVKSWSRFSDDPEVCDSVVQQLGELGTQLYEIEADETISEVR